MKRNCFVSRNVCACEGYGVGYANVHAFYCAWVYGCVGMWVCLFVCRVVVTADGESGCGTLQKYCRPHVLLPSHVATWLR